MNLVKKMVIALSILSFFSLHFPRICDCRQNHIHAKAETSGGITKHTPEFLTPPEQEIPESGMPGEKGGKGKTNKWLWIGLGVLATGVIAGLSNRSKSESSTAPTTGDITIQWKD